jgi:hypothetical protein
MPSIAKIRKQKITKMRIPPSCFIDLKRVSIKVFIDGIIFNDLSGLNSLNVLIPDIFYIAGKDSNKLETTTIKSS